VVWVAIVVILAVLAVALLLGYRHAQSVQDELAALDHGPPPPMFAGTQRKIRRASRGN
jgi:hypothetical protein